jgi:hypothetical protein
LDNGERINTLEYEELAISNRSLSFDDWLRIRQFHFFIGIMISDVFLDLRREVEANDLDVGTLARHIMDDSENWPETFTKLMADFRQATLDELIEPENVKFEYDPAEVGDKPDLKYIAVNYYYFAKLVCEDNTSLQLAEYLPLAIRRFFDKDLNEKGFLGLDAAISLCFDRLIPYESFKASKTVSYLFDVNAWQSSLKQNSIMEFRTNQENEYILTCDDGVQETLKSDDYKDLALLDAVYLVRNGFIGARGEKVFAYQRAPLQN